MEETGEDTIFVEYMLVVGVSNYNSVRKKKCITQMEKLIKQKMTPTKNKCSASLQSTTNNTGTVTTTNAENGNDRNRYKKVDSPYLLGDIIRKLKAKGKGLKFDKVYSDHHSDDRRNTLLEIGLTTFYKTTLLLLKESNLLTGQCKILLWFNSHTLHYLNKAWNKMKQNFTVKFLSDLDTNLWYKDCEDIKKRIVDVKTTPGMEMQ